MIVRRVVAAGVRVITRSPEPPPKAYGSPAWSPSNMRVTSVNEKSSNSSITSHRALLARCTGGA